MRIKKHKKNEYILSEGVWVRNLCSDSEPIDINSLGKKDLALFLENECENLKISSLDFDEMNPIRLENVVIMSDGYRWKDKQKVLGEIPNSVVKTIGVNGSLAKWEMVGDKAQFKRTMTFYLANNPYSECSSCLPKTHKYFPNLIASTRTNPNFMKKYGTQAFFYRSPDDAVYSGFGSGKNTMKLDDYRNPICAAISFAWKMGVKKLALLCCDEAFDDERPGATKMKNGLYQYPTQIMCQKIIDAQLYWLKKAGVGIFDSSSGIEYENATYIESDKLKELFKEQ